MGKNCCNIRKKSEKDKDIKELRNFFDNFIEQMSISEIRTLISNFIHDKREKQFLSFLKNNEELKGMNIYNINKDRSLCSNCFEYFCGVTLDSILETDNEFFELLDDNIIFENDENKDSSIYSINDLIHLTKKEVIGQDELIKKMATIFYMHQLKVIGKIKSNKSVIPLITGGTGTGKTLIIKTMSKLINVPFISLSMDTFTSDGWEGENLTDYLIPHLSEDNFDHSIVYIDEFDKIHSGDQQQQHHNKSKQNRLLTFFDGENLKKIDNQGIYSKLTSINMQIVLSGAYRDFLVNNGMGFGADVDKSEKRNLTFTKQDIINFGLLPELAGRITQVYNTRDLNIDDYKNILQFSESGYLKYYETIMLNMGVTIKYTSSFIHSIAEKAYKSNLGARDLNNYLFDYFQPVILEFAELDIKKAGKNIVFNVTENVISDLLKAKQKINKNSDIVIVKKDEKKVII